MNSSRTSTARLKRQSPWHRDLTDYNFQLELLPRYADINPGRHLSNIALLDYHTEAQMQYQVKALGLAPWFPDQYVLRPASQITDFLVVTGYPAPIQGGVTVVGKNSTSYRIRSGLFQHKLGVCNQDRWMAAWRDGERIELPMEVRNRLPLAEAIDAPEETCGAVAADCYPLRVDLKSRYDDHDADRCIGESAIAGFMEHGRSQLLATLLKSVGMNLADDGLGLLAARIAIDFRHYGPAHGNVQLAAGAERLGRSSFTLRVGIFNDGCCLALADTVMVCISRDGGKPVPIPARMRRELELWLCDAPEAVARGERAS